MNIVMGSLSHESNSFNPKTMELSDFSPVYGDDVFARLAEGGPSPLQGIYKVITSFGAKALPTIFARATPGGLVSLEAYQAMKGGFLRELRKHQDIAGVCLHLHGSMVVEKLGDAEGDLLTEVRKIVGDSIPIVTSLDMHATITATMMEKADAFVGFRTAPHVDTMETGEKAARLLLDSLTKGYRLTMCAVGLPLLVSGEMSESAKPPMVSLIEGLEKLDQKPKILSSSLLLGFPWVDVRYNQGSALVVTKDDPALAQTEAIKLAKEFWSKLGEFRFTTEAYPFAECLALALKVEKGPVCLADCGDNPGAGGSQNLVYPLQVMLEQNLENTLFGAIADEVAYEYCLKQELGSSFELTFGRLTTEPDSLGITVTAKLKQIGLLGQMPAVVVGVGGIDVVISKDRIMMLDPKDLEVLGLKPRDYRILVLKSGYLDPKYEAIASYGLLALTPGFTNQDFTALNYQQIRRPMHPLDQGFHYDPSEYILPSRNREGAKK